LKPSPQLSTGIDIKRYMHSVVGRLAVSTWTLKDLQATTPVKLEAIPRRSVNCRVS
jgi:hypothetical protein